MPPPTSRSTWCTAPGCDAGLKVHYVQNVTDVDDPLLERAARDGEDWQELAEREIALFREDMAALGVLPPQHYVGAVEAIPGSSSRGAGPARRGRGLRRRGATPTSRCTATRGSAGSAGSTRPRCSRSSRSAAATPSGPARSTRWTACCGRRAARASRPGTPGTACRRRPGWHIECTAIALDRLGTAFDVQGGGSDLVFPHHEMGASEAHVLTGDWPFARHYVHAGMVGPRRREDVEVQGQPGLRVTSAAGRSRPDGDPAGAARPPLPRRLGVDRPGPHGCRGDGSARWQAAVARPDRAVSGRRCSTVCDGIWPTTSTRPARSRSWTGGSPRPRPAAAPTRGHRAWSPGRRRPARRPSVTQARKRRGQVRGVGPGSSPRRRR